MHAKISHCCLLALALGLAPAAGMTDNRVAVSLAPVAETQSTDPWMRRLDPDRLQLRSAAALIVDTDGTRIYGKHTGVAMPIASITKLMTAIVVLDAGVPLSEKVTIRQADRDLLRLTGSRLHYDKAKLTRAELLKIALMSSENRAAAALGRTTFPGGTSAFVEAMNRKARVLGMRRSTFVDPTGLDAGNMATAEDLIRLLRAADDYLPIRRATTTRSTQVHPYRRLGKLRYSNTNRLLKNSRWDIQLSKTGYIDEAGHCLVMRATIADRTLYIVLLNSFGKLTPFGDSNRLRKWIESGIKAG